MVKYEITFDLDFERDISYDPDEQNLEINYIDDDCFTDIFGTTEKIKEFEDWYNEFLDEKDKVKINYLEYDSDGYGKCYVMIEVENPLKDENDFAKQVVDCLFDGNDYPRVSYHISGTTWEDYWDGYRQSPEQRTIKIDYDDSDYIYHYDNLKINKLS